MTNTTNIKQLSATIEQTTNPLELLIATDGIMNGLFLVMGFYGVLFLFVLGFALGLRSIERGLMFGGFFGTALAIALVALGLLTVFHILSALTVMLLGVGLLIILNKD